jgi:hypothetical protein
MRRSARQRLGIVLLGLSVVPVLAVEMVVAYLSCLAGMGLAGFIQKPCRSTARRAVLRLVLK